MLGSLGQIRQVFGTAINPVRAAELQSLQAANLAAVQSGNLDTLHAKSLQSVQAATVTALPAQLQSIQKGQSAHFQQKTVEYYRKLVSERKIDPRTVTPEQFIGQAEVLSQHDPLALGWGETAARLLAFNLVGHALTQGNHERAERADALYQLEQVRAIGIKQAEARLNALGKDQMLISPAALAVARERAER